MTSVNTDREQRDMPVNSKYETVTQGGRHDTYH